MRQVTFEPQRDLEGDQRLWWDEWSAMAAKATQELLDAWNADPEPEVSESTAAADQKPKKTKAEVVHELIRSKENKERIWGQLKDFLLENVFHKKCAYCEGRYTAGSFNDAEHWRPKGKVTVKLNGKVITVQCPEGRDHPGYFWLAFDWRNLLPACERCNGSNGKMNQFPVTREHVCEPGTAFDVLNAAEDPLLIHPYKDDPKLDIEFVEQGVVKPRDGSGRGEHSIAVFDLGRGDLDEERAERQEEAEMAFIDALGKAWRRIQSIEESMATFTGPKARFSEAVRAHVNRRTPSLIEELLSLGGP